MRASTETHGSTNRFSSCVDRGERAIRREIDSYKVWKTNALHLCDAIDVFIGKMTSGAETAADGVDRLPAHVDKIRRGAVELRSGPAGIRECYQLLRSARRHCACLLFDYEIVLADTMLTRAINENSRLAPGGNKPQAAPEIRLHSLGCTRGGLVGSEAPALDHALLAIPLGAQPELAGLTRPSDVVAAELSFVPDKGGIRPTLESRAFVCAEDGIDEGVAAEIERLATEKLKDLVVPGAATNLGTLRDPVGNAQLEIFDRYIGSALTLFAQHSPGRRPFLAPTEALPPGARAGFTLRTPILENLAAAAVRDAEQSARVELSLQFPEGYWDFIISKVGFRVEPGNQRAVMATDLFFQKQGGSGAGEWTFQYKASRDLEITFRPASDSMSVNYGPASGLVVRDASIWTKWSGTIHLGGNGMIERFMARFFDFGSVKEMIESQPGWSGDLRVSVGLSGRYEALLGSDRLTITIV